MRALLISANQEDVNMAALPLGLALVAAAAERAGHEVELLDLMRADNARGRTAEAVRRFQPEAVGISVRNIDDQNMLKPRFLLEQARAVVDACRENSSAPLILGGAGYSIFPKAALDFLGADMGVQGEGEWAFAEILRRLQAGESLEGLPGLYLPGQDRAAARRFSPNLDDLPWAGVARWLTSVRKDDSLMLPVQTRRGCPMRCSYCSTPVIEGTAIRRCSPELAAGTVAGYVASGFRKIFFTDNTFNLPPSFAKAFCRGLIAAGVKPAWNCIVYPGRLDEELASLLAGAGCVSVSLGFESGDDEMLARLNKRFTSADVARDRRILAEAGISVMGFLMLGAPGETRESVLRSLDFIDRIKPDIFRLTMGVRIYPYTPLAGHALTRGLIAPGDDLLQPTFYLEPGLEDWLPETLEAWAAGRTDCLGDIRRG